MVMVRRKEMVWWWRERKTVLIREFRGRGGSEEVRRKDAMELK